MTLLRVMTYNILRGGQRGQPLVDVVRAVAPDILMVNESPKRPLTWGRDCRRLAELWGLQYVVGGRSAGSNLVAVRAGIGVKAAGALVLPQPTWQPRRGIAWAQLRVEGRLIGVVSCHLSLHRERRPSEVSRVLEVATDLRGPVVVAGDLNESPDGRCWELLRTAGFDDHGSRRWPTFPSEHPERRIDAVLVRGDVRVRRHGDPGVGDRLLTAASDHRPVLVELDLE